MKTFRMNNINDLPFFYELYAFTRNCYDINSPVLYNYTNGMQEWSWCNNLHAVIINDDSTKHHVRIYVDELLMGEFKYKNTDSRNLEPDTRPTINTDDFYDEMAQFINRWGIMPQSSMDLLNDFSNTH